MKSLIALLLLLTLATSTSAQDDWQPYAKGTKLVGFSLNSQAQAYEEDGMTLTQSVGLFNVQFGYFLADGFVIGLDLNSQVATQELEGTFIDGESTVTTSEFGLFASYYFRLGQKHAIYPEIRAFSTVTEFDDGSDTEENTSSGATLGVGYTYRINSSIGLDAKLRVGSMTTESDGAEMDWSIASLLVGFQIFF
jgi:opacity protein-like surface antigen